MSPATADLALADPDFVAELRRSLLRGPTKCTKPWAQYLEAGRSDSTRIVSVLAHLLTDPEPGCRAAAAEWLGDAFGPQAIASVPGLARSLTDPAAAVRIQAARALARVNPARKAEAADVLFPIALRDPDVDVRIKAARSLAEADPSRKMQAIDVLLSVLAVAGPNEAARYELSLMGNEAIEPTLTQLRQQTGKAQHPFIQTLAGIGSETLPAVRRELANGSAAGRVGAARTLGQLGSHAEAAFEDLVARLSDPDTDVQKRAALALVAIDPDRAGPILQAAGALPVLIEELMGRQRRIAWEWSPGSPREESLLVAIRRIGTPAARAIPQIRQAFQAESNDVRAAAASALAVVAPELTAEAVECLMSMAERLCSQAIEALADIGPAARQIVPRLKAILLDPARLGTFGTGFFGRVFLALARIDAAEAARMMDGIGEDIRSTDRFQGAVELLMDMSVGMAVDLVHVRMSDNSKRIERAESVATTTAPFYVPLLSELLHDQRAEDRWRDIQYALETFGMGAAGTDEGDGQAN